MFDPLDPLRVDRELSLLARRWVRYRRRLRQGEGFDDAPFASSSVAGRTAFTAVSELPDEDPLKVPLGRWIYRLAEQRINQGALVEQCRSWREQRHAVDVPERGRFSLAELLARALADRPRRRAWADQLVRLGAEHTAATARLWERRQEIARRLGLESPDPIERACLGLETAASRWLAATDALAAEFRAPSLADFLTTALAEDASEGWPARTGLRPLLELLNEHDLFRSLAIDAGPLPEPISGSSYLRAFARIGAAWVDATAPRDQPFVIAHDPYGLRRRTVGALFALLALNPAFLRRKLGLGRDRLRDQRRALARAVLLHSRSCALRLLLREAALASGSRFGAEYESLLMRVHGIGAPPAAAGVVFRLRVDDDQRFSGLLLGQAEQERLVDAHDEDWFRNPRAVDQLRSEAQRSPVPTTTLEDLGEGQAALLRLLLAALG